MKKRVVIIGTGGTAVNIAEQVQYSLSSEGGDTHVEGFVSDAFPQESEYCGFKVLGGLDRVGRLLKDPALLFIFALWKPEKMAERYELFKSLEIPDDRLFTFIHPLSWVSPSSHPGPGTVVFSGASVHGRVTTGRCCIINSSAVIEHDTVLGDGFFAAAGAVIGSGVKTGKACFAGLNSSVRENITLGDNVFIGMHSLVVSDFSDCRVKGVPARVF